VIRISACILVLALVSAARPDEGRKPAADPVELVFFDRDRFIRVELLAEVEGKAVSAIWNETFARILGFFDRDGNGLLDAKEAARLPSALALRQSMNTGFTPPIGDAPAFADLDADTDSKVTLDELAAHYRSAGLGNVQIGVGRLPAGRELSNALLTRLDVDGDGRVAEAEWKNAAEALKKLDANSDELIGAGELLPKTIYPGAAGTTRLTPPRAGTPAPESLAKFPFALLPKDRGDRRWADESARRNPAFQSSALLKARQCQPDARWTIRLEKAGEPDRVAASSPGLRVEAWPVAGKATEAFASARRRLTAAFGTKDLAWLVPFADRNADGILDRDEFDAWLALQEQIMREHVYLTLLDDGSLFELLDADHDGALSVRELRTAWRRLVECKVVADGAYDPKKVPRVILAPMSRGYPKTIACAVKRGPAWFQAMDKNGDGDVSRLEFTGPGDVFDKLDSDRDGLLTPQEAGKAKP
jgi:Ca2+-binding EF-hand superfamily protein